jgi:hypothetical protein
LRRLHRRGFLMDGGVTAAYWFGEFAPERRVEDAPAS